MGPKPKPLGERFWRFVDKSDADGCWIWIGCKSKRGYGKIQIRNNFSKRAHRVSWELAHGCDIPEGMMVLHTCDNPSCVRPDHLYIGNGVANMRDASERGRISRGERRYNAIIPDFQIPIIRRRRAEGASLGQLAEEYGVSKTCIWAYVHYKSRAWIK